jgi:hypothetical protein
MAVLVGVVFTKTEMEKLATLRRDLCLGSNEETLRALVTSNYKTWQLRAPAGVTSNLFNLLVHLYKKLYRKVREWCTTIRGRIYTTWFRWVNRPEAVAIESSILVYQATQAITTEPVHVLGIHVPGITRHVLNPSTTEEITVEMILGLQALAAEKSLREACVVQKIEVPRIMSGLTAGVVDCSQCGNFTQQVPLCLAPLCLARCKLYPFTCREYIEPTHTN